jgi:hypothetical protein
MSEINICPLCENPARAGDCDINPYSLCDAHVPKLTKIKYFSDADGASAEIDADIITPKAKE